MRVIIADRTIASPSFVNKGGVIPRGVSRTYRYQAFTADQIKEFGKSAIGSVEFTVIYGPHDGDYVRPLKMKLATAYTLSEHPGIADVITSESETDYTK